MWLIKQAELLRAEVNSILAFLPDVEYLHDLVKEALTKACGLIGETKEQRLWRLLPLVVCEKISGNSKPAIPVAAAIQLLKAAAEVFDDIEDEDSSESLISKYGAPISTNIATTLIILAEYAITRLKNTDMTDRMIVRVMKKINSSYAIACAGQHMDIHLSSYKGISEEIYFKIIGMKSASQVECACYIGALLAKANNSLIKLFSLVGYDLGMASQIANDIQGVLQERDIINRNFTLPIIFALNLEDSNIRDQLRTYFYEQCEAIPDPEQIKEMLFDVGAIHYSTIKMELFKQRIQENLAKIEAQNINVNILKSLLQ